MYKQSQQMNIEYIIPMAMLYLLTLTNKVT